MLGKCSNSIGNNPLVPTLHCGKQREMYNVHGFYILGALQHILRFIKLYFILTEGKEGIAGPTLGAAEVLPSVGNV